MAKPQCLMPDPAVRDDDQPVQVSDQGLWMVISDIHLPHHDKLTVELAVEEARRRKATGVLLNGDVLDSGELSRHARHKSVESYRSEIGLGVQLLGYIRSRLPKARIIFKAGNHEERFGAYVQERAAAFDGLEGFNIETLLHMDQLGIEYVTDRRIIRLGKLNVIHGHEYRGGGGVNPARWLYLRAHRVVMCGHFHRSSEHHEKDIEDYNSAAWSTGCACYLRPEWLPLNTWNHGFATVELASDRNFKVSNRRVLNGEVV